MAAVGPELHADSRAALADREPRRGRPGADRPRRRALGGRAFAAVPHVPERTLAPDDPAQARSLAQAELERARELGQPGGIGVALRVGGFLAPGDAGITLLDEAVGTLRAS
ncbi:MAG: hypothetical protein DLM64_10925 [Solirubrobacterales bacterium]|nr:MAG: hypothetical protein DLM64_10925 [Solirubrobacterales bacterium]